MRESQIESRVLNVIERVCKMQPVESSHIELKREWIDPKAAARAIAGMCNAAGGEPVLFLIGLDEKQGKVTGASLEQLADWWPQVKKEFDQEVPTLLKDLAVHSGDHTIVALLLESSRAPYVVRNPAFGVTSGNVSLEVPWREGGSLRTARREDLIRLLTPAVQQPDIELKNGLARYIKTQGLYWDAIFTIDLFIVARSKITAIADRTSLEVNPSYLGAHQSKWHSMAFTSEKAGPDRQQITFEEPRTVQLYLRSPTTCAGPHLPPEFSISLKLGVLDADRIAPLVATFRQQTVSQEEVRYCSV